MKRIALLLVVAATGTVIAGTAISVSSRAGASAGEMPFTFYLTHYKLLGSDPNNPTGVRYQNNGAPTAKAPDGSTIELTGKGGWDPARAAVQGGGRYTVTNKAGTVTAKGTWKATKFVSFVQLPGWWGIKDFKELGWQGPPGSPSFSGTLTLNVELSRLGKGVLRIWCLMPTVPKPKGHVGDGFTLTGPKLRFTGFKEQEMSLEGVMFYGP
jgi:hypothetical protein